MININQADKIQCHPGFYGAAELEFIDNKAELESVREYNLGKEPMRVGRHSEISGRECSLVKKV